MRTIDLDFFNRAEPMLGAWTRVHVFQATIMGGWSPPLPGFGGSSMGTISSSRSGGTGGWRTSSSSAGFGSEPGFGVCIEISFEG
jgi:hypothetical protein